MQIIPFSCAATSPLCDLRAKATDFRAECARQALARVSPSSNSVTR